jgi:hypothetical protein
LVILDSWGWEERERNTAAWQARLQSCKERKKEKRLYQVGDNVEVKEMMIFFTNRKDSLVQVRELVATRSMSAAYTAHCRTRSTQ